MTAGQSVPAVTVEQMREVDRLMIEEYGILLIQMMENAGRGLSLLTSAVAHGVQDKSVLVLAGKGNNGGGALVAARHLSNMGAGVRVVLASPRDGLGEIPAHQASILDRMGLTILDGTAVDQDGILAELKEVAAVVDGLLGYSLDGAPRGPSASLIEAANECVAPVVSLDVPSGVSATDGRVYEPSMRATATLTLALPKTALESDEARTRSGDIYLGDISVPPALYRRLGLEVPALFADGSLVALAWTGAGWTARGASRER